MKKVRSLTLIKSKCEHCGETQHQYRLRLDYYILCLSCKEIYPDRRKKGKYTQKNIELFKYI